MKDWRSAGPDTIAVEVNHNQLQGFNKTGIVKENLEAIVVLKEGLVDKICTAGSIQTLNIWESIKNWAGIKPNLNIFFLDITPRTLEFWLEDPAIPRDTSSGESFGMPVLTSDGQLISAQVNLTVSIDIERPDLLLRALHGSKLFTINDLRKLIRDELLAKVITPALAKRTAEELRGNHELLEEFYQEVVLQLSNTLTGYGLKLDTSQFSINWGLTQEEAIKIEDRRREAEIKQAKHQKELERILVENNKDINADNTPFSPNIQIGRDFNYSENNGLSGIWISLIVATIFIGIIAMMFLF
tara:strand:+ start:1279 stop:2178 length:900 start_codon:yes stop_codon:yes gene_type:complete